MEPVDPPEVLELVEHQERLAQQDLQGHLAHQGQWETLDLQELPEVQDRKEWRDL